MLKEKLKVESTLRINLESDRVKQEEIRRKELEHQKLRQEVERKREERRHKQKQVILLIIVFEYSMFVLFKLCQLICG